MNRHRVALMLLATVAMLFPACRSSRDSAVADSPIIPVKVAGLATMDSPFGTLVPLSACVEGHGMVASVFMVQKDDDAGAIARRLPVQIANISEDGALLLQALPEGAGLVTTGAEFLTDGTAVVVVLGHTSSGKPPCRSLISSCETAVSR